MMPKRNTHLWLAAALLVAGCATVSELIRVEPPRFEAAEGRRSELRLLGPSSTRPLGGAAIRIWTRVQNPNAFGLTLSTLEGDLLLEGARAAASSSTSGSTIRAGSTAANSVVAAASCTRRSTGCRRRTRRSVIGT